jgi:hypothetical protein
LNSVFKQMSVRRAVGCVAKEKNRRFILNKVFDKLILKRNIKDSTWGKKKIVSEETN